jgi:hypothetical protein
VVVPPKDATWVEDRKLSPAPYEYITNHEQIRALWNTIEAEYEAGASLTELREKHSPSGLQRTRKRMLF